MAKETALREFLRTVFISTKYPVVIGNIIRKIAHTPPTTHTHRKKIDIPDRPQTGTEHRSERGFPVESYACADIGKAGLLRRAHLEIRNSSSSSH